MTDPSDRDRLPFPCEDCGRTLRIARRDLVADTGRPYLCVSCAIDRAMRAIRPEAGGAVVIEGHAVEVIPEERRLR